MNSELYKRHFVISTKHFHSSACHNSPMFTYNQPKISHMRIHSASAESLSHEQIEQNSEHEFEVSSYNPEKSQQKPKYENRFLIFARVGSVINNAAESFFKSEIRRLFVTAALLVISRVGYFIPLPGFDRRLVPENYLSFVSVQLRSLVSWHQNLSFPYSNLESIPKLQHLLLCRYFDMFFLHWSSYGKKGWMLTRK